MVAEKSRLLDAALRELWVSGACMRAPRRVVLSLGMPDEKELFVATTLSAAQIRIRGIARAIARAICHSL